MVVDRGSNLIKDVNRNWRTVCEKLGDRFPPPYIWDGNYIDRAYVALGIEVFDTPVPLININNIEPDEGTENYRSLKMLSHKTMSLFLGGITIPLTEYDIKNLTYVEYRMSLAESHPFYSAHFFLRDEDTFYHSHRILSDAITHGIMNDPRNDTERDVIPLLKKHDPIKEPIELTRTLLLVESQRPKSRFSNKNSDRFLRKIEEYSKLIKNGVRTRRKNFDGSWSDVNFSSPS
jgi:hypothetical protein